MNPRPEEETEESDYDEDWMYHRRSSYSDVDRGTYDRTDEAAFATGDGMMDDDRDGSSFGDS
jgi:hypothetical protein